MKRTQQATEPFPQSRLELVAGIVSPPDGHSTSTLVGKRGTLERPRVSVIVPAYRAEVTIERCLASLLDQTYEGPLEVIVVASGPGADELRGRASGQLRVIASHDRVPAAVARNRGVEEAAGDLLAFTDADVIADRGWIAELARTCEGRYCVAGAVVNGTPLSAAGTVEYWTEFLDLHPSRPPVTLWHGATCNLLLPRALWEEAGPFAEDMTGGEDTLLTAALRRRGLFRFAPSARVEHLNRTTWRDVVRHQHEIGRFTAHVARRGHYKLRPLVRYWPLAPVAVLGRLGSVYVRIWAWDRTRRARSLALLPGVLATLLAWGLALALEGAKLDLQSLRRRLTS